jgi:hypothetical protein
MLRSNPTASILDIKQKNHMPAEIDPALSEKKEWDPIERAWVRF